jgi:hypothetical protein
MSEQYGRSFSQFADSRPPLGEDPAFVLATLGDPRDRIDNDHVSITLDESILPDLMKVGMLKAQGVPRTDAAILELDRKTCADTLRLLRSLEGTLADDTPYKNYREIINRYIGGEPSVEELKALIADTFHPAFGGRESFLQDVEEMGAGLLLANHNTHTPEVDVMDWGTSSVVHDIGPIVTRLGMDIALGEGAPEVTRFVKTPHPSEFYLRAMNDLGNVVINGGGVDEIVGQMRAVVSRDQIPAFLPEGGFRVLDKWSSGPVVLAVKSGLRHVHLVAHSPLVSFLNPSMRFDYLGTREIPEEVVRAVELNDRSVVGEFADTLRTDFAVGIQALPYPRAYKEHVARHIPA